MTANKPPLPTRRRFLNKATYGACATTVLVSVPELWVKPVVQSIIIPAHAQTSTDDSSTTTPCSDSVTIEGGTWDCDSADSFTTTSFGRSNGCIVVSNTEDHSSYITPASHQLIVGRGTGNIGTFAVTLASSTQDAEESHSCRFPNANPYSYSYGWYVGNIKVEGYSYVANFSWTIVAASDSTTISEIVLTPE